MQRPNPRIVRHKLHHKKPRRRRTTRAQKLHVSSLRIFRIRHAAVPNPAALGEHPEVVSVQMHRMNERGAIVQHDAHGGVGAEVVNVPLGVTGVGDVA